ncbi:Maf family protein [Bowmanella dokdonensis]|nr:nucleoside triphosphate pyrophosphatase [Bowmanella dokdonensis]
MSLILASTSPFRKSLLEKLGLVFETASPDTNETPLPGESARDLVRRLAESKATSVAATRTRGLIIGSDQVACLDGLIIGKPHTHEKAVQQLESCSGKAVRFYTGLCLHEVTTGKTHSHVEVFEVLFRPLSRQQIDSYLIKEQPYQCAGSFKSEGLGICLFEKLEGRDPNSLIGLPLIALTDLLREFGIDPLTD